MQLPEAPGSEHRPAPLVLPVAPGAQPWRLPAAGTAVRELAAFLAVLDLAPAGAVLDVAARSGEHALLAAVYGTRLVRAVQPDPDRAHAARQAAATNALPVIVEERRLVAPGEGNGETLDAYVSRTGPAAGRPAAGRRGGRRGTARRRRRAAAPAPPVARPGVRPDGRGASRPSARSRSTGLSVDYGSGRPGSGPWVCSRSGGRRVGLRPAAPGLVGGVAQGPGHRAAGRPAGLAGRRAAVVDLAVHDDTARTTT